MMWIGNIGFMVWTKDTPVAGTDSLVTVEMIRNGNHLFTGRLDFPTLDDLEPGSVRFYGYEVPARYLDRTPPLPDGVGRIPPPYPDKGVEFSDGLIGHLACRLRIHGNDLWTKDRVDIYVKETRLVATSFDTEGWRTDQFWTHLGMWTQDVDLSTDSTEGPDTWTLVV
jgi:hypothetical protein